MARNIDADKFLKLLRNSNKGFWHKNQTYKGETLSEAMAYEINTIKKCIEETIAEQKEEEKNRSDALEQIKQIVDRPIGNNAEEKAYNYMMIVKDIKEIIDKYKTEDKEPTTKNDLGVDCIDRQATLDAIIKRLGIKNETYLLEAERAIYQQILAMPSVTPQEPILEKIRAEIKALSPEPTAYDVVDGNPIKDAVWETLADVLQIIDKNKAESEEV